MNIDNTEKLVQAFPKLYRNVGGDPRKTCMAWGFECGDGWFQLIWDLSAQLEPLVVGTDRCAMQVKEKFGTLRFYVTNSTDQIEELISEAEDRSETTCEVCGSQDATASKGPWITTRCKEHQ